MNTLIGTEAIEGKSNAAGLRKLRLIMTTDVVGIMPNIDSWIVPKGGILLREKTKVISMKFAIGTYNETLETNEQGDVWQCTIEIEVPRDAPNRTQSINSLRGKRFIGLTADRNGTYKVLGTLKQPLRFGGCVMDISTNTWKYVFVGLWKVPSFYSETINIFNVNTKLITL